MTNVDNSPLSQAGRGELSATALVRRLIRGLRRRTTQISPRHRALARNRPLLAQALARRDWLEAERLLALTGLEGLRNRDAWRATQIATCAQLARIDAQNCSGPKETLARLNTVLEGRVTSLGAMTEIPAGRTGYKIRSLSVQLSAVPQPRLVFEKIYPASILAKAMVEYELTRSLELHGI
ncbi:hypothetical protein HA397_27370, partial [Escherichia coli]|nr:hypothetical protein [Escherichia coli]